MIIDLTCGDRHQHFLACTTCQALAIAYITGRVGSTKSGAKAKAARENGKKGGRPKKVKV